MDDRRTPDFLAQHRRERVGVLTDRLVATIAEGVPGRTTAGLLVEDDLRGCWRGTIEAMLGLLGEAVEQGGLRERPADDQAHEAARETGRRAAVRGLPLDDVLRCLRLAGQVLWDDLVEHGQAVLDPDDAWAIGTRLWQVVDETSARLARSHRVHARARRRAGEQRRADLWEGVLSGRARELGFASEAARLLDLPSTGDLLVVNAPRLETRNAEARLRPHATAWVCRAGDVVGLVALREDDPTEALAALQQIARRDHVPLGVSSVVPGLAEAGEGLRQATLALHAQGAAPGSACFEERLPEAVLLGSPEIATRMVTRWLEPVLALGAAESDALLATVAAWVEAGGSSTRAAAAVPCHRNTVMNRLRRVSELVGHPLADEAVPVELDLALRGWRMGLRA